MKVRNYIAITYFKWNFIFGLVPTYWSKDKMVFHFGIFFLKERPEEGTEITKNHYRGFWIQKEFKGFGISCG